MSPEKFLQLSLHSHWELGRASEPSQYQEFCSIISGPHSSLGGLRHGASHSSLWIPLDIYLEDCVDGSVAATNAIEIISGKDAFILHFSSVFLIHYSFCIWHSVNL